MTDSYRQLDELDLAICSLLRNDGRRTYTEIAKQLGVSDGTVRYRVSKLLEEGSLQIVGRFDPYLVGLLAPANVRIAVRPAQMIEQVASQVATFPEVQYIAMLAGDYDLEIDVMCRNQAHLTWFITEQLHEVEGVDHTETNLILRVYKHSAADLSAVYKSEDAMNPLGESPDDKSSYR